MREILFRGQTRRHGEMLKNVAGDPMPSNWVYGGVLQGTGAFSIIYGSNDADDISGANLEKHVVYTDTLGQYTGLKDKNGKRIFEGDIVSTDLARPFLIVEFRNGSFMFNCNDGGKDYYDLMFSPYEEDKDEYRWGEIIGNIHDNPELLEVEG